AGDEKRALYVNVENPLNEFLRRGQIIEAQRARLEAARHDLTSGFQCLAQVCEAIAVEPADRWHRFEPYHRLGDDAQSPFGTDKELEQNRITRVIGHRERFDDTP